MRVLFVCTSNRLRSPTAEKLFTGWPGLEVSSAGLDPAATRVVDEGVIASADVIFVMERHHRDKIRKRFRAVLGQRPVYVLGIPDEYEARPAGADRAAEGKGAAAAASRVLILLGRERIAIWKIPIKVRVT
jgi:predicted protein tyrosine phosphatase